MGVPGPTEVLIPYSPANYAEHWCSLLKKTETPFGRCHSVVDPAEYYKVGGTHTPRPPCHRGGLRALPGPHATCDVDSMHPAGPTGCCMCM